MRAEHIMGVSKYVSGNEILVIKSQKLTSIEKNKERIKSKTKNRIMRLINYRIPSIRDIFNCHLKLEFIENTYIHKSSLSQRT